MLTTMPTTDAPEDLMLPFCACGRRWSECDGSRAGCRTRQEPLEPPAGSYAATARAMADLFPDFDWDAWKDEMKDAALGVD
ncbi:MAG: hypothetical protein EKK55_01845 [Rhodocyclaceae bacterium]|nr:MAG: hypothetical protein EKK55_01845 [Rhodocyclaceae bacterium]